MQISHLYDTKFAIDHTCGLLPITEADKYLKRVSCCHDTISAVRAAAMPGKWDCTKMRDPILGLAAKGAGSWKVILLLSTAQPSALWLMPSMLLASACVLAVFILRRALRLSVADKTSGRVLPDPAEMLLGRACCACWDAAACCA